MLLADTTTFVGVGVELAIASPEGLVASVDRDGAEGTRRVVRVRARRGWLGRGGANPIRRSLDV